MAELIALHEQVDRDARALALRHADRLNCRLGCAACCVDGIAVFAVEAQRIRDAHADLLRAAAPHRPGACAFLGEDAACRIYRDRPYVCRTQGLPLRWMQDAPHGGAVEHRDICPENEAGPPLVALSEDACWTIGPTESRLAEIARAYDPALGRVALRDLFATTPGAESDDDDGAAGRRKP